MPLGAVRYSHTGSGGHCLGPLPAASSSLCSDLLISLRLDRYFEPAKEKALTLIGLYVEARGVQGCMACWTDQRRRHPSLPELRSDFTPPPSFLSLI